MLPRILLSCLLASAALTAAERINHAGRILGTQPTVVAPILFNTPEADAVVSTMQIMPRDSAWNEDVSMLPVAANSDAMMTIIRNDLLASQRRLVVFKEMNYVLVPDNQALVDIEFLDYPDESDDLKVVGGSIGEWPIPSNLPVETWPSEQPTLTLLQWQQDTRSGDRHSITVKPGAGFIWETWQTRLTSSTPAWQASNGAKFPLSSNAQRPDGWTSGDAAGLPMFPALVRYDEVQRGAIEHAMRIVVKRSRRSYIYPASHQAGSSNDPDVPAMGQRLRLKSSFVIPAGWSNEERVIAVALKRYGALVADNGNFFSISICPDDRWPAGCFDNLATGVGNIICDVNNFEVVVATGINGGPRSSGAPTTDAGADQTVTISGGAALVGSATGSGLSTLWSVYGSAPGTVTFANANSLSTTASFSATGTYTLMLRVADGIHTPAYDAVVITVQATSNPTPVLSAIAPTSRVQNSGTFTLTASGSGFVANAQLTWSGRAALSAVTATANQLTFAVPATYLATPGTPTLGIVSPAPGGGTSASQILTITADTTAPVISAAAVGSLTATTAIVTWTTNEPATSVVDYGVTTAYGSASNDSTLVTSHSRTLSGLNASTTYHLRITSVDGAGNSAQSGDLDFNTTAAATGGGGSGGASGGGGGCGIGAVLGWLAVLGLCWLRGLDGAPRRQLDNASR